MEYAQRNAIASDKVRLCFYLLSHDEHDFCSVLCVHQDSATRLREHIASPVTHLSYIAFLSVKVQCFSSIFHSSFHLIPKIFVKCMGIQRFFRDYGIMDATDVRKFVKEMSTDQHFAVKCTGGAERYPLYARSCKCLCECFYRLSKNLCSFLLLFAFLLHGSFCSKN